MGFIWSAFGAPSKKNLKSFKIQDVSHTCAILQFFFIYGKSGPFSLHGKQNLELPTAAP